VEDLFMTDSATPVADWRDWIAGQFELLGRWFRGRFVVEIGSGEKSVAAEQFMDGNFLRDQLLIDTPSGASADHPQDQVGGTDTNRALTIAASRLSRHYSAPLTTVAITGLAAGVAFDLSPRQCTMVYANGVPFRLFLGDAHGSPVVMAALAGIDTAPAGIRPVDTMHELRQIVWRSLYRDHLAPLYRRLATVTRISPALTWTNAAEWLAMARDSASEYVDPELAGPIVAECQALLTADRLPGLDADANLLRDRIEWPLVAVDGQECAAQTRKICCLCYLHEDRFGRLCQNCPYLPAEERVTLTRERHGIPAGSPGGTAEQRAIARGLQRPGIGVLRRSR
jgi:hypothetical protein